MIRRIWVLPAVALVTLGAVDGGDFRVSARAGIDVRTNHGHFEVATIIVDVRTTGGGQGEATFAADGHHHGLYPDLVVILPQASKVFVRGNIAEIQGQGSYQGEPASIRMKLLDGGLEGQGDFMTVECYAPNGKRVFYGEGPTTSGDISIRTAQ